MTTTFTHILVPFDDSASSKVALNNALKISEVNAAKISLVYVQTEPGSSAIAETIKKFVEMKSNETGKKIEFIVRSGKVHKEIVAAAEQIEADLIVMGTHGVSGFEEFWIGSNAFRVVSSSKCPVITMQEHSQNLGFKNIVLPLADSKETRQKVPMAASLAKQFGATVHIFAVSKDTDEDTTLRIKTYAYQTQNYLEEQKIPYTYDIKQGVNVSEASIEYAKKVNGDLIMIMTETEAASVFMGTYAQQLVNHSPIPVFAMHPREVFITYAEL